MSENNEPQGCIIKQVHRNQGPEIIALQLQDMYLQFGFSPEAARLLIREQGLDDEMIAEMITRMLHLPPEKNRLHNEQSAQSVKEQRMR